MQGLPCSRPPNITLQKGTNITMTDNVNSSATSDEDGLFDGAKDTFPSKFDLRDRLVVIYPDGEHGERQGENGKPYPWYSSTTVVLDDGPDGWQDMVPGDGGELQPNLVPSVDDNGPQVLTSHQWSTSAHTSRMKNLVPQNRPDGRPGSILGRINVRKNSKKGLAAPWGIAPPTEADMMIAREHTEVCKQARQAIVDARQQAADSDAF